MKKHIFYILDVFTEKPFGGNQLAVFPYASEIEENYYQKIARELNFSETVFVLPASNLEANFKLRIFTPFTELPMAGHPTIGTAHLLKNIGLVNQDKILVEEGVGNISVTYNEDIIWMNQLLPKYGNTYKDLNLVSKLLSLDESDISSETLPQIISCGIDIFIVRVNSLEEIKKIKLNLDIYEKMLNKDKISNIMVFTTETEQSNSSAHSRFFAPALGIHEDSATGSATGPLAAFLVKNKLKHANKIMQLEQGFEMGRPAILYANIGGNKDVIQSVQIGGKSVLIAEGSFYIY